MSSGWLPEVLARGGTAEGWLLAWTAVALLWAVGLRALRAWGRSPSLVLWLLPSAVQVGFAVAAAAWREAAVAARVREVPTRQVAAVVASTHASAGRVLAWALALSALTLGVSAVLRTRGGRLQPAAGLATAAAAVGVAVVFGVDLTGGVLALALVAVAFALARPGDERHEHTALAVVALWCGAAALVGAAAAVRHDALVLAQPEDVALLSGLPWREGAMVGMAVVLLGMAAVEVPGMRRWPAGTRRALGLSVGAGAVALAVVGAAALEAHRWAPPSALDALEAHPGAAAPIHPDPTVVPPHRITSGCLVRAVGEGWEPLDLGPAPTDDAPAPCDRGRALRPSGAPLLIAPAADQPSTVLTGWFEQDLGILGVVWRLADDPPASVRRWAWGRLELEHTPAPRRDDERWAWVDLRARPVPGPVLVDPGAGVALRGAHRVPLDVPLSEAIPRLAPGRRRLDVLVLPDAAWTVQDVLEACVDAASIGGSVRCRLATGDADVWRAFVSEEATP